MKKWPYLKTYDERHLRQIALPLGGIGTGTVSLGGRGNLMDWEIMHRPAKGFDPEKCFFALNLRASDGSSITRVLEGPIDPADYNVGEKGSGIPNHGLPRFRSCRFKAAYPLGQIELSDPDVPVSVSLQAFNPLVPGNVAISSIPTAIFRFVLTNDTDESIQASVCGSIINIVGWGAASNCDAACACESDGFPSPKNSYRENPPVRGILMTAPGLADEEETNGSMALSTSTEGTVTYKTIWNTETEPWGLREFWQDFSDDGRLEDSSEVPDGRFPGSLAVLQDIPPRQSRSVVFYITWHFPNRYAWPPSPQAKGCNCIPPERWKENERVGNHYAIQYQDAWDVAMKTAAELDRLETATVEFSEAYCESDLPEAVKEAALFNISTLRTQICFRTEDGLFFGFEGCTSEAGCCLGSCSHVWGYEFASGSLFGELSRSMREVQFLHATDGTGRMSFRVHLPIRFATEFPYTAADGQMACLIKLYLDWQWSGDSDWLRRLWPRARTAMEFCWIEGGWDPDQDGVMEGCQHNTTDFEVFGPHPLMAAWYLAALKAVSRMAEAMGDTDFAVKCRHLFESGRKWVDDHIFNGDYYEQQIRPMSGMSIADGLNAKGQSQGLDEIEQLGSGCQADQLAGQYAAHVAGLGDILEPKHVRKTLKSIMEFNYRDEFYSHFNILRSFALGDEAGLIYTSYPRGDEPQHSTRRKAEAWTGVEYTAAVGMLFEGLYEEGLKVFQAVRQRYDGYKRNPFSEVECGQHYARAMAAWSGLLALTGFQYSAVDFQLRFRAAEKDAKWFWSNGYAWGCIEQKVGNASIDAKISVGHGSLKLRGLELTGWGRIEISEHIASGGSKTFKVPYSA